MTAVDISGLSKAAVLAALFNASSPGGMGFLQSGAGPRVMDVEYAERLISDMNAEMPEELYFDYLYGRVLKVDLTDGSSFDPWGFDRDNGQGSAQRVIDILRQTQDVNPLESQQAHEAALQIRAHEAMAYANTPGSIDGNVIMLGGADVSASLVRAVDQELDRHKG